VVVINIHGFMALSVGGMDMCVVYLSCWPPLLIAKTIKALIHVAMVGIRQSHLGIED
jgi:hypothetical protein